jgi:hypothetical protein
MHKTLRLFAVLGAAAGIYFAAALQSGPIAVDANICATARRWYIAVPDHCAPWIDTWVRFGIWLVIALCLGFLAWDFWSFLRSRPPRPKSASHSQRFIGIMEAIYWIAEKSAWGRWQDAQRRGSGGSLSEIFKFNVAEHVLRTAAENGELLIKGRQKKSVEYKDFDQHFWRTAYFEIQPNPVSLWKATVRPRAGADVSISEYDDVLVEKRRVEILWPRRDWQCDWLTLRLNLRSVWKRMKDQKPIVDQPQAAETPAASPSPSEEVRAPAAEAQPEPAPNITVTPQAPKDWEQLFVIGDDGKSVWLRFLPDTKSYRADTLVLIVYGHKVLRGVTRIRMGGAHAAVQKTIDNAPHRPTDSNWLSLALGSLQRLQADLNLNYVDECVPLYLERVALSQGGMYQLTKEGETHAATLAYDLIRRA